MLLTLIVSSTLTLLLKVHSVTTPSTNFMETVSQAFHPLEYYSVDVVDVHINAPFVDDYIVKASVHCPQNIPEFDKVIIGRGETVEEACCDCCFNVMDSFEKKSRKE